MTDVAHTYLCQPQTLILSRNSYDTQLLCLCRSLSHGNDWVFPFSVGLHTLFTTMCTSWEFFDKKQTKMVDLMFWAPLLQRTFFSFCTLSTGIVLTLESYILDRARNSKKLNKPYGVNFWPKRLVYQEGISRIILWKLFFKANCIVRNHQL